MPGDPQHATDELIAYVVRERPDWEPWAVRTAIGEALLRWTWERTVTELVRLLWDPNALPGNLVPTAAPAGKGQPLPRSRVAEHAAAARAGLPKRGGP